MSALNPITHENPAKLAAALALDPATMAEERLKQLLYLWLRFYFSGTAFVTLDSDGDTMQRTFTACDFKFQDDEMPNNALNPIIHLVFPDIKTRRLDFTSTKAGHDDDWTIDAMVKVPSVLANTQMPGVDPEYIASKVAGELAWLLDSTERGALNDAGISRVKLQRPPAILPAAAWKIRMLVFTCRTRREIPKWKF